MNTYTYSEKNGNATIIISEESEEKAFEYLKEIVKFPREFRLTEERAEYD